MKSEQRRPRRSPYPRSAVLIVEDDGLLADATADAIEAAGYRTIRAADGWQAIEVLKREQPSVLLVDMLLPGMSGSEFLRFVRGNPIWSQIPRVIMTGTNDHMTGVREDSPVFFKPLNVASLVAVVQRYCDQARPQIVAARHARG